jgi:hypothetical protein
MLRNTLFIVFLFCSFIIFSQKVTLRGTVKDSLKTSLSHANVIAKPKNINKNLQFAITDAEGYYELMFNKGDTLTISISYLGYTTINYAFIANTSTTKNFILKTSNEQLDEIIIEMPVTVKGDTTTFKTSKFITGEERKLKNVLKKLPGVEVGKDGSVTVQGKKVTKMLVDGKKFFGGNSKLAVENIPADAVDKVQVIDNYNEVAFLKNLTDSDEMAMNIQLKEDKKHFVFGDIEGGKGNDNFYKTNANLFYYSPKTNVNFIGNVNNIGEKTFTFKDYLSFQGGVNAIFSGNFSWNGGDFSQFLESKDVTKSKQKFGALNITKVTTDKLDISGYAIFSKSEITTFLEAQNDYSTFSEFRENRSNNNNLLGIGKFNMEYAPSSEEQWYIRSQIKGTDNNRKTGLLSTINTNTNIINTDRDLQSTYFNQNIEWHKRQSVKNTFSTIANYSFSQNDGISLWETSNDILQGLIPVNNTQQLLRLQQLKNVKEHNLDMLFKHFWELNNSNHIYTTVGNKYSKEFFITDDSQELDDGSSNNFSTGGFGNNLNFSLNDFFIGLHYKFRTGIFTIRQGINMHQYSWEIAQQNTVRKNKWVLLPDFLAKIEFNKSKKIQLNYGLKTSFSDASRFANQFYLQSYNSVFKGNENLENNLYHSARIYYSRFSLYRGLMININANYRKQVKGVSNTVDFQGINQFITPIYLTNPSENFRLSGRITKRIKKIKYKASADYSLSKYKQPIENTIQNNTNKNYSYDIGVETLFKNFPTIDIGFKQSIGNFTSSSTISKFTTNEPYINIDYDFWKGFIFSFDYIRYDYKNKALGQQNMYEVANTTLSYRKENSAWSYKIFVNNMFGANFKQNNNFSQFLISDTKTYILPRILMFSIGYNL